MLAQWLARLGQNPQKSWTEFKLGLAIFVLGALLIVLGPTWWLLLQLPGVICLAIGLLIAAKGYVGIFAHRFSQTLSRLGAAGDKDKNSNR